MKDKKYNKNDVIDLVSLFFAILRKWWLVLLSGIICAGIAFGYTTFMVKPLYKSSAILYIVGQTSESALNSADIQLANALAGDYTAIATSNTVVDDAISEIKKEHKKEFTRGELKGMLSVVNKNGSHLLEISATSTDPKWACWAANAIADVTALKMAEITALKPLAKIEEAEVSTGPISPNIFKNIIMGFLVGTVIVCGIIIILFLFDDKIKTEEDIEKELDLPILISIPYMKNKDN